MIAAAVDEQGQGAVGAGGRSALWENDRVIEEEQERFTELAGILDGLPDAAAVLQGPVALFANRAMLAVAGAGSLEELNAIRLLDEKIPGPDRAALTAIVAGESDGPVDVQFGRNGQVRTFSVQAWSVRVGGQPARCLVARDVTVDKTMRAGLAHADRLASIGSLAAGVAHEINNPLSFVMYGLDEIAEGLDQCRTAFLELLTRLSDRFGAAKVREIAAEVGALGCAARAEELRVRAMEGADGSRRIKRIVSDLRSLARADDGGRLRPMDPAEVVRQAVGLTRHSLRHQAALEVETSLTELVMGSEGRLVQVLVNLLVNAGQAVGETGQGTVRVTVEQAEDQVLIRVADDGPGIPEEVQPHVFEAFFTTKAPGEGSGLGLWICRDIVREHGGRLEVASRAGAGATFTVTLPVARPDDLTTDSRSSGLWTVGSGPARVLLVDDEPLVLSAMRRVLRRGHRVKAVASAEEAKALLERSAARFDVVVCDLMMDGMTGMDLYAWLEQAVPRLAQRFVVVSGGAVTREARDFLASSAAPVLVKPVEPKRLRRAVDALHTGAPWPRGDGGGAT